MEKDVLSQVIEAEKEIQKCLEAEKVRVREWLEETKKETNEAFLLEEKKIRESQTQSLAEASRQAGQKADAVVRQAARDAARLEELGPEALSALVQQRISGILPG